MNRTAYCAALLLATAGLASAAHAEQKLYKCVDANGQVTYTQSFDPNKCTGGGKQFNKQGVEVKSIDRAKTPEELAADKAKAEADAEAKRLADEKAKADQVLLQSYPNEDDLIRVRDAEVRGVEGSIETTRASMKNQEQALASFLTSAAEAERAGQKVPEGTQANISKVRAQIKEQQDFIARRQADQIRTKKEFEEKIARYRELKKAQDERNKKAADK